MKTIEMVSQQEQQPRHAHEEAVAANGEVVPEWLGDKLKELFSNVMTEPVPEDLVALLQQLEKRDQERR